MHEPWRYDVELEGRLSPSGTVDERSARDAPITPLMTPVTMLGNGRPPYVSLFTEIASILEVPTMREISVQH